ncbi:MAG: exostosin family protein [Cryomorphaceae bacterium]
MTLRDYQNSSGFAIDDQIYLINNPNFPPSVDCSLTLKDVVSRKKRWINQLQIKREGLKNNGHINLFFGSSKKSTDQIAPLFKFVSTLMHKEFKVLLGKGDYDLDNEILKEIPKNVISVIGNNVSVHNDKLRFLPMGRDFRSKEFFQLPPQAVKQHDLYVNFSLNTHARRPIIWQMIKSMEFVTADHMGQFLNYEIGRDEFYTKMSKSKFCLCPRGNGLDTFRMWDALYLGAIPIVEKSPIFHEYLKDLPILFVEDFKELNEWDVEKLNIIYNDMLNRDYNYKKLDMIYWLKDYKSTDG